MFNTTVLDLSKAGGAIFMGFASKSYTCNCPIVRLCHLLVLYGCETWSLTLREERGLRVFDNRVLRRIFGSKRDGVTG